jgi:PAS domain S-box-containing protein
MGVALLVKVSTSLVDGAVAAGRTPPGLELALTEVAEEAVERASSLEALVLGAEVDRPLELAARAQARDPDLSVVVLTDATAQDQVVRALRFAPGLQGEVRFVSSPDEWELGAEVTQAVETTRRRRQYRGLLAAANAQVRQAGPPPDAGEIVHLGRLLDVAPVGVCAVDGAGRVVAWNQRAAGLFERPAAQVLGRPFETLLPAEAREQWEALLQRSAELQAPVRLELERTLASGSPQQVELTASALATAGGPPGLLLIFQDTSARAAAERERAQLLRQTQLALSVRDEFLQVASHELRTPLTSLRLMLQSLQRDLKGPQADAAPRAGLQHKVDTAERQVVRLTRLVEGLLDVSSVQSGRLRLERTVVELAEVVEEAVAELADAVDRAGCRVELSCERPVRGPWDGRRLRQVVGNLLANALRYAPGTTIEIVVRAEGSVAVAQVRDRGIGIAPEDLARIFDRFERAAPTRNYGGLGLGLFISRKIVEAHGGTLVAQSQRGAGATFRLELPLRSPP